MKKFLATFLASSCIGTLGIAPSVEAHTHHHHHHHHHHHPVTWSRKNCEENAQKQFHMSCEEAILLGYVLINSEGAAAE